MTLWFHQVVAPILREATEDDLPRLMELLHQLHQLGERPEATARNMGPEQQAAFRRLQASEDAACLVLGITPTHRGYSKYF